MTQRLFPGNRIRWKEWITPQVRAAFFGAVLFGLFCHGTGLTNKLSHQDDIANLFGFGATVTSGRWMLHVLCWLEGIFFGTGNASLPLFNGLVSILCVALSCALLVSLLKIRSRVYAALAGGLMIAFPVMAVLFSYMFTSHPYMAGLLMTVLAAYLICRETPWWAKALAVGLGAASIGVYQGFIPVLLAVFLAYDILETAPGEKPGSILRRAAVQALCTVGIFLVYFAVNKVFLWKFQVQLSSYQGIDRMGMMTPHTFLRRVKTAYLLFFLPGRNPGADMYPGTLRHLYRLMLAAGGVLGIRHILRTLRESRLNALLLCVLYALLPLGCNFIYVMTEEVHGLMVYGQAVAAVLLAALLDRLEQGEFRGRRVLSLAASLVLGTACLMYARFDNQCYLKDTLQQQAAVSYYTTLITRIKSQEGYTPETEIAFVDDYTDLDPTIYDLEEMSFIRLNLYGHSTTEYIHYYKEFFMQKWCGFQGNWYWRDNPEKWPEVKEMPSYPADGSVRMVRGVLVVKF